MDSAKDVGKHIGDETLERFRQSLSAVEKKIYFRVVEDAPGCSKDKPYGVIGEKSGVVHGCHSSRASANKQLSGLYAATDPKSGYKPSKEDEKNLETPEEHDKRREREKKAESSMADVKEGDIVRFMLEDEESMGRVEYVMRDGSYAYPGSKFFFQVQEDNPAVLIRIWDDGEETNLLTGLPYSQIRVENE